MAVMIRSPALILVLSLLYGLPPSATAQERAEPTLHTFARIDTLDAIRLSIAGSRVEGRFRGANESGLLLQLDSETRSLQFSAVDTLWIRGRSAGTGALVGAAILGLGTSILFGWANHALCDAAECGGEFAEGFRVGALVGVPAGALLGAAIGLLVPKWHRRYP
jgi:hypothetical protein